MPIRAGMVSQNVLNLVDTALAAVGVGAKSVASVVFLKVHHSRLLRVANILTGNQGVRQMLFSIRAKCCQSSFTLIQSLIAITTCG